MPVAGPVVSFRRLVEAVVLIILFAPLVSVLGTSVSEPAAADALDEEPGVELAEAGTALTAFVVESCDPEFIVALEVLSSSA